MQIEYFQVTVDSDEHLLYYCFIVATGLHVQFKYGRSVGNSLVSEESIAKDESGESLRFRSTITCSPIITTLLQVTRHVISTKA
jgi:hypothetical protein